MFFCIEVFFLQFFYTLTITYQKAFILKTCVPRRMLCDSIRLVPGSRLGHLHKLYYASIYVCLKETSCQELSFFQVPKTYLAYWVILHAFLSSADFFFQINFFFKYYFRNTIRVSNSLDPDQARA